MVRRSLYVILANLNESKIDQQLTNNQSFYDLVLTAHIEPSLKMAVTIREEVKKKTFDLNFNRNITKQEGETTSKSHGNASPCCMRD